MSEPIIPAAKTIAVTSGKGGVGKTTTAAALAAALTADGVDVILMDADIAGPNVHLVCDLEDPALGVDSKQLHLELPKSPFGFRVLTPVSVTSAQPSARVDTADLIGIARFTDPAQVVVVDLPPGWTDEHEALCGTLPDLILTVTAPTPTAVSDHQAHVSRWTKAWASAVHRLRERDRRRKLTLPEAPTMVAVETMARFTGLVDGTTEPVTIRRLDALPAAQVTDLVNPIVSIPATAGIAETARTTEVRQLAAHVMELVNADAA